MVGLRELESLTSTMSTWRSNQLSYNPLLEHKEYYTGLKETCQHLEGKKCADPLPKPAPAS